MKRFISLLLFVSLSFATVGCFESSNDKEIQTQSVEFTNTIDGLQLQLGKILSDPNGIDQKALSDTMNKLAEARQAFADLKDSGASWFDISKGAIGGIFGRTLVHGLRGLIIASMPGPIGSGLVAILGFFLGGSKSGREQET